MDLDSLRAILDTEGKVEQDGGSSACVASYDYDLEAETLTITFPGSTGRGGSGVWQYADVPLTTFLQFATSGSLGRYFNSHIRTQYSFNRIN